MTPHSNTMEWPKSKVVKSKSSNSAIAPKSEKHRTISDNHRTKLDSQRNKKSKSSAEFQVLPVKRRGVYVENKLTKLSLNEPKEAIFEEKSVKPLPRPKPGSKRFLASVLSILSKSTTGTQYPDATVDTAIKDETKVKNKKEKKLKEAPPEKKKKKFRSKVLNDNKYQVDKFEVLQCKKEIIQTPSLYSEKSYKDDIKWSDLPRLVKPEDGINNIVKEVTEGRKAKKKKVTVVEPDPTTLVSEREDKKLYNFFVNLIETTFSVYNVKAEYDAAPIPSAASSNIALEINESVARKLNVGTEMLDDVTQKPSKHFYCLKNNNSWDDHKLIDYFQSYPSSTRRMPELPLKSPTKNRRSESFSAPKRSRIVPQCQSVVVTQRKSCNRKKNKQNLLNLLKDQLRMDDYAYEEPQNLYQALKVMAKTKRKAKTISFDRYAKKTAEGNPDCMLKRRKIITSSTKSSKYDGVNSGPISMKASEVSGYRKYTKSIYTEEGSNHSLEVYGFDYEIPYKQRSVKREETEKELFMTYHSSPSNSDHNVKEMLQFADSGSSSTIRQFTHEIDL